MLVVLHLPVLGDLISCGTAQYSFWDICCSSYPERTICIKKEMKIKNVNNSDRSYKVFGELILRLLTWLRTGM